MTFFTRINKNFIKNLIKYQFNTNKLRYSHHHSLNIQRTSINLERTNDNNEGNKFIINLLGESESVDTASWEIQSFAKEKSLLTANIVYNPKLLSCFLFKHNYLQFIVNRCYNMSCQNVIYLNQDIINTNTIWKPYNLYVIPEAKNRFVTCDFIRNCDHSKFIVYPLAASKESKRRDINILIE